MGTWNFCAVILGVCLGASQVSALVIDGNLSDWGVTVADNDGSNFTFSGGIGLLGSQLEDQSDTGGDTFVLGPNRGGQNFDGEALAVAQQNGTLYVMLVTGQRPDNGFERYAPGDIQIFTSAGTFGLELGGGIGGGAGSALAEGALGSTYTMNPSGLTSAYADADPLQTAGSLWTNVTWLLDPIAPQGPTEFAINGGSNFAGLADYVFTRDTATTQHSIIELSIPLSLFGGASIDSLSWRPACGNDELDVSVLSIPEPATLSLLGVSASLVLLRRRRAA